jgi:hypothetical protein
VSESRLIGNLRTLGVFPCGECRAFVASGQGCEHYRVSPPRHVTDRVRTENGARFDDLYGVMRLADSTRMRAILERAASGEPVTLPEKNDRHSANSLTRAGLLSQVRRGGPYSITDKGREVWRKVLAYLNEGV